MGAVYVSSGSPWPTTSFGHLDTGPEALRILRTRVHAIAKAKAEQMCGQVLQCTLAELGPTMIHYAADVRSYYDPTRPETAVHAILLDILDRFDILEGEVTVYFNTLRWHALTGAETHGDMPEMCTELDWLNVSGICDAPLDAPEFIDLGAVSAANAVLDSLVARVHSALTEAELTPSQRAGVNSALEKGRLDLGGAATMIRHSLTTFNGTS